MRKLCDKNCGLCNFDECLQKYPPYDWVSSERYRTDKSKEQRREYARRKREICIAFGICRECMCRVATNGKYCIECYVKRRKRNDAKKDGISRYERTSYGLCYFCGKPVENGFKTCTKHHKMVVDNVIGTTDTQNHPWRKQDRLIYQNQ